MKEVCISNGEHVLWPQAATSSLSVFLNALASSQTSEHMFCTGILFQSHKQVVSALSHVVYLTYIEYSSYSYHKSFADYSYLLSSFGVIVNRTVFNSPVWYVGQRLPNTFVNIYQDVFY